MIPVLRRAVGYGNEVEWKSIYIPQTRSAERLAVPKSKGNPVIKRIGSSQIIMGSWRFGWAQLPNPVGESVVM